MSVSKKALAAGIILFVCALQASAADYKAEYDKKIKASQNVGVLGNNLAGDSVNFYTGSTEFSANDVAIPGNFGLDVALGRSYSVEPQHQRAVTRGDVYTPEIEAAVLRAFGDWDLDIPHISTVMTQAGGWVVNTNTPLNRCSIIGQFDPLGNPATGAPPKVQKELGAGQHEFGPGKYWHGYTLHAGGGGQTMLVASSANTVRPDVTKFGTMHWTTNKDWWVSCLPATANSAGGEGFRAISPDGTRYTFDWLSKRNIDSVTETVDPEGLGGPTRVYYVYRAEYLMLPTSIEDRFGNWVHYTWSSDAFARLLSISSSDGRSLTLSYNAQGHVSSVTDGTRTWIYRYTSGSLTEVELPDGSKWKYSFAGMNNIPPAQPFCPDPAPAPPDWHCFGDTISTPGTFASGYVEHPSGARVDFNFGSHFQFGMTNDTYYSYPLGLISKTVTGPGLEEATWKYEFSPNREQASLACQASACPTRIWTDEIGPDQSVVRRMFGVVQGVDQTMLLQELHGTFALTTESGGGGSGSRVRGNQASRSKPGFGGSMHGGGGVVSNQLVAIGSPSPYPSPYVLNPDGSYSGDFSIFSLFYDAAANGTAVLTISPREGEINLVDDASPENDAVPVFLQEVDYFYVSPLTTEFAAYVGADPSNGLVYGANAQAFVAERRLPVSKRTTLLQNVIHEWEVTAFNSYGRPAAITLSSSGGLGGDFTRSEIWTYKEDMEQWVIGLPLRTTDPATDPAKEISKTDYTPALLPSGTYAFGILQSTMAYNADGTLASVTDGRGKTITLTNWYRGIPRSIAYPGSATEAATVNGLGWITSTTDELNFSTGYGYDSMGRLSSIAYPTGDSVNWNPLDRHFDPVTSNEFGLGSGHWKQTVSTGTGKSTTYYDARWQPVLVVSEDTVISASKTYVVTRYDSSGRVIFQSYPVPSLGDVDDALTGITTSYDALGRVFQVTQDAEAPHGQLTTTTEYLIGGLTRVTNPKEVETEATYQVFDQPSLESPVRIVSAVGKPEQQTTTIARDRYGKPLSVKREGASP